MTTTRSDPKADLEVAVETADVITIDATEMMVSHHGFSTYPRALTTTAKDANKLVSIHGKPAGETVEMPTLDVPVSKPYRKHRKLGGDITVTIAATETAGSLPRAGSTASIHIQVSVGHRLDEGGPVIFSTKGPSLHHSVPVA